MIRMSKVAIPFEESWSTLEMAVALRVYLCALSSQVFPSTNPNILISRMISTQFKPLFGEFKQSKLKSLSSNCLTTTLSEETTLKLKQHDYLNDLMRILSGVTSQDIQEIILASYFEKVIFTALGDVLLNEFVQKCFVCEFNSHET